MRMREVVAALKAADPVDRRKVERFGEREAEAALLEEILAEPVPIEPERRPPTSRRNLRYLAPIAISVAGLAALLLVFWSGEGRSPSGPASAYGARLIRFAESTPRILIGSAGWRVDGVEQAPVGGEGEMGFVSSRESASEKRTAELNWYPPLPDYPSANTVEKRFADLVEDRAHSAEVRTTAPVIDTTAQVFQYVGGSLGARDIVALWVEDGRVLEFRSVVADMGAFERLLGSLRKVDPTTWLDAMPPSVIKAADQPLEIDAMLKGVPLPPGFDAAALAAEGPTVDRYGLGARVVGAVACTWFARWSDARQEGDRAATREAVQAMATAGHWPVLRRMSEEGAYSQVIEDLASAMPRGTVWRPWMGSAAWRPLTADVESALGCSRMGIPLGPARPAGG